MRAFQKGISPLRAGAIAIVLLAVGSWFAFYKDIPLTETYKVHAVVQDSNLLQARSPVRIAGYDVGKVVKIGRYKDTNLGLVTMEIEDKGRPVRDDATIKIRPRLFLEGNFFVDLKPGTPNGDELPDGGLIPVTQTATPVQLHEVLTALQSDTRRSLQDTLIGFGEALNSQPSAADDADQDPDVRGLTGAQALNKALDTAIPATRDSAINAEALRGTQPRDLSRMIEGIAETSAGLARNENQLKAFVVNFNTAMAAFASEAPALHETIDLLGPTASNLNDGLASIDAALPPTRRFARAMLPGLRATPPAVAAFEPWLEQGTPFFGPNELGRLLKYMTPATRDLARVTHTSLEWLPKSDNFNRCVNEVMIPTGNIKVEDGPLSANVENYKEFWYSTVAQAGEGQGFDGNGTFLRLSAPGGSIPVTSGNTNYTAVKALRGNATSQPLRTRPAFPNQAPPLNRSVPCHRNPVPDVNGPSSIGPADGSRPKAPPPPVPEALGAIPIERASSARLVPLSSLAGGDR